METGSPRPNGVDAVVFAVTGGFYRSLEPSSWLGDERPAILDANGVLTAAQRTQLRAHGCRVESIGRGAGL